MAQTTKKTTTSKKKSNKAAAETTPVDPDEVFEALPVAQPTKQQETTANGTQALAKNEDQEPSRESALSIVGGISTADLKNALSIQTEQRSLIKDFVKAHLKEDVDFGRIHVVSTCNDGNNCKKDYHYSKSILFKPGQEKIFSLFGLTDEITKDEDAYEMLPDAKGMVAYRCIVYRGNKRITEGRGAATLQESQNKPNTCIKKAEKRARMDACLSLGFSEYFTQDLDDPDYASARDMANAKAASDAAVIDKDEFGLLPRDPEALIDNNERAVLHKMMLAAGFSEDFEIIELLRVNGVTDHRVMKSGEARMMMKKLKNTTFADPGPVDIPPNEQLKKPPKDAKDLELPPLDVDDELKEYVQNEFVLLNLNSFGEQWFMRMVAKKPWAKFDDKLTDNAWREAYDLIEQINRNEIKVQENHLKTVDRDYTEPTQQDEDPQQKLIDEEEPKNEN